MAAPTQRRPGVFAVRDVSSLVTETQEARYELKRSVTATQLTAMGVGAIIGTGIFVVIGEGAGIAGPAVIRSLLRRNGRDDSGRRVGLCLLLRNAR